MHLFYFFREKRTIIDATPIGVPLARKVTDKSSLPSVKSCRVSFSRPLIIFDSRIDQLLIGFDRLDVGQTELPFRVNVIRRSRHNSVGSVKTAEALEDQRETERYGGKGRSEREKLETRLQPEVFTQQIELRKVVVSKAAIPGRRQNCFANATEHTSHPDARTHSETQANRVSRREENVEIILYPAARPLDDARF